jgi:hypothetical protein
MAHAMLTELAERLPKGYQVYGLFDSWYSSAKLIKFCRRQGWQAICALKFNRRIDKKRIDRHDQTLKHQRYQPTVTGALPRLTLLTPAQGRQPSR